MTSHSSEIFDSFSSTDTSFIEKPKTGFLDMHSVEMLDTSEAETEKVYQLLTNINSQESECALEELCESIEDLSSIDKEMAEIEELLEMEKPAPKEGNRVFFKEMQKQPTDEKFFSPNHEKKKENEAFHSSALSYPKQGSREKREEISDAPYMRSDPIAARADFAKKMHQKESTRAPFFTPSASIAKKDLPMKEKAKEEQIHGIAAAASTRKQEMSIQTQNRGSNQDREGKEGQQQEKEKERQEEKPKKKKKEGIEAVSLTLSGSVDDKKEDNGGGGGKNSDDLSGIGDIFGRFMALMTRILGQAQADAHILYQRIKERTDNVDVLTTLLGKLNTTTKKIDWSKDEAMKALVDKARAIGVEIPEGKYTWTEDEKRALRENIQMRKDTLEKMTQLERTDMQRFMQEASQCHQARSNVLKLMKEIGDNIISNMRGH